MDAALLDAVSTAAARFAREAVAPMVGTEGRDGALEQVPALYAQAEELGLVGTAGGDEDDGQRGIWAGDDSALPVAVLEALAGGCGGFAAAVHYGALAAREAGRAGDGRRVALAAPSAAWVLAQAGGDGLTAEPCPQLARADDTLRLSGRARFVYGPPDTEAFVVYAAADGAAERVLVERSARGSSAAEVGPRGGLAALGALALELDGVPIEPEQALGRGDAAGLLARTWLGLCAIAVGNAQGALDAARRYAAERYQGGDAIARHPVVQQLLGSAEARIGTCRDALQTASAAGAIEIARAACLRVELPRRCADAVSDCLQVLGGYGYMEDYRLEKRLRDALALGAMAGRRSDVQRWLAGATDGGGR